MRGIFAGVGGQSQSFFNNLHEEKEAPINNNNNIDISKFFIVLINIIIFKKEYEHF